MNNNEQEELDAFHDIFKSFPDLLKGNVKQRFDNLVHKRNCELMEEQEKMMAEITATLAKEISDEIDKDIINTIMQQSITTANTDSLTKLAKMIGVDPFDSLKVEPDIEFNDNDPWTIGAPDGIYTKANNVITPGKSKWNLVITQNQLGWYNFAKPAIHKAQQDHVLIHPRASSSGPFESFRRPSRQNKL